MSCAFIYSLVCISFTLFVRSPSIWKPQGVCQPSGVSINQNVLPYRHNHVTLLIWNVLDTLLMYIDPSDLIL